MSIPTFKAASLCLVAMSLAGCATTTPVKEVLANPDVYLSKFSPATLPADVASKISKGETPIGFSRMEFQRELTEVRSDVKTDRAVTAKVVMVNAGNGLIQSYEEVSNNLIPFRINYKLSYRGFLHLRWQTVFLNRENSDQVQEVKALTRLDSLKPNSAAGTPLEYGMTYGSQIQIANYRDARDVCNLGETRPASELSAGLEGQTIDLTCEHFGPNGQVTGKSVHAYLQKYGVAVQRSYTDSNVRNTYVVKSVKIQ
ncbi:MAG: hypothetical protein V4627_07885 [Pseudomonadota bacterium]